MGVSFQDLKNKANKGRLQDLLNLVVNSIFCKNKHSNLDLKSPFQGGDSPRDAKYAQGGFKRCKYSVVYLYV